MLWLRNGEVIYLTEKRSCREMMANTLWLTRYSARLFLAFPILDDQRALQSLDLYSLPLTSTH